MERHFLAVTGGTLLAQRGSAGERRSQALHEALDGRKPPALTFEALGALPDWMRAPRETQADVARRAALLSIGPALARSIDGGWLKDLAEAAGEDALDWALAEVEGQPDAKACGVPANGARLSSLGFGLAAASLPEALRPLLGWARPGTVDAAAAAFAPAWIAAARNAVS